MPELPEVETVRRALSLALEGGVIRSVEIRRNDLRIPFPENLAAAMREQKVKSVFRRGKYILMALGDGQHVALHLGMSGRVRIMDGKDWAGPAKHDHFIIHAADGKVAALNDSRRFGMVFLTSDEWEAHPAWNSMGPEPLDTGFSASVLRKRLGKSSRPLKLALLDQRVVAGLGNIYVCEALHMAGLSPFSPAGGVSAVESERLVSAIKDVLSRAIDAGGSTLRDYSQANGETGYFQFAFSVYDREAEFCRKCVSNGDSAENESCRIERVVQSGRSTFYCPRCQS